MCLIIFRLINIICQGFLPFKLFEKMENQHSRFSFSVISVLHADSALSEPRPLRWPAAHYQAEAVVAVRRPGGKVRLVARRREPIHSIPSAHAGDGSWEESLGQRMPQPPLDQLLAKKPHKGWSIILFLLSQPSWKPPSGVSPWNHRGAESPFPLFRCEFLCLNLFFFHLLPRKECKRRP